MNFFIVSLKTNMKRLFRPSTFVVIGVLAVSLAAGAFVQKELFLQARIGVLYDEESEISQEIISAIESFSNINVKKYDDINRLLDDIAAVKVECGYVFNKDIEKYIENGQINRAVKLYKSKSTVADGFTNELVFAALTKTASPYIAANYLRSKTNSDYTVLVEEADSAADFYYDSGIFMDLEIIDVGGAIEEERPKSRINAGIVSVFLFIAFFYIAIGGVEEKKSGMFEKLSKTDAVLYLCSYVLAYAVILYAAASVLFVSDRGIVHTLAVTGIYVFILSVGAVFFAAILKSAHSLYALFPIISIIVIMLGGAFFDPGVFVPVLGKVARLLPTYYFVIYML